MSDLINRARSASSSHLICAHLIYDLADALERDEATIARVMQIRERSVFPRELGEYGEGWKDALFAICEALTPRTDETSQ